MPRGAIDIVGGIAAIIIFYIILTSLTEMSPAVFWAIVLVCIILLVILAVIGKVLALKLEEKYREDELEQEKRNWESVRQLVAAHIDTLARKRRTLIRNGDYGEIVDDAWRKEIKRFLRLQLRPAAYASLGGEERTAGYRLETLVDGMVSDHIDTMRPSFTDADVSTMNGVEYEAFCGEILEREGWKVQRTPPTGDHGVDLIAVKPDRRVAIQCKKYSSPVGNKAVQEAYSGMKFFDAEEAVVVTNSTFTQAAQVLANKLSVALKHHDELVGL